ncbi:MAG TPA: GntR family transcriptional regulator [Candidatus Sulfotelmatobacter sp.]|jgi:DNA-binding GntR family transcriptional regulator|nr:GntR family transcriptional regulator [Candidatus Sulfotelmatobacter sp.]
MENSPPTRLSEQFRERIEESIVTGAFPPGTRLDEVELAELYGASRTPIREALIQLGAAGFIDKRPRKGWEVAEIPPSRLCEMFDVMAELEAMCGRLAARRASEVEQRRVKLAHEACLAARKANDPAEYYRLNEVFHHAIYDASHNTFLIEQARALHRRLRPYRRLQLRVRNRMHTSFDEHERIVGAILAGEGALAAELLRSHVVVQGERFADLVASLASLNTRRKAVGE